MARLTDEAKNLILFLFLLALWWVLQISSMKIINFYWLTYAEWGITFYGYDLRTWFGGFLLGILYAWLLWLYWDWRDYKRWRKENPLLLRR